jgi:hypothetical protein
MELPSLVQISVYDQNPEIEREKLKRKASTHRYIIIVDIYGGDFQSSCSP